MPEEQYKGYLIVYDPDVFHVYKMDVPEWDVCASFELRIEAVQYIDSITEDI